MMRRPLLPVLILIAAALAGYVGWTTAGGQAESQSAVVVVPPWSLEDVNFKNPMLNLGDRATALAGALVVAISRSDVEEPVRGAGAISYEVSNMTTDSRDPSRSAVIFLTVIGPDENAARAGSDALIDRSRAVLKEMQEQSGTGDAPLMATLQVISQPEERTTFSSRQLRSAGSLSAAVLVAGLSIFWAVESLIERRSRTRRRKNPTIPEDLGRDSDENDFGDMPNVYSRNGEESFVYSESGRLTPRYSDNT
jgi:hypothetical protein